VDEEDLFYLLMNTLKISRSYVIFPAFIEVLTSNLSLLLRTKGDQKTILLCLHLLAIDQ